MNKKLAMTMLNASLATGADYAEIFYEDTVSYTTKLENGKVETSSSNSTCGVGLRLLKENQCVYGYTNNLSKSGLLSLADSLSKTFSGERLLTVSGFKMIRCVNRHKIGQSYCSVPREEKINLIKEGIEEITKVQDPRIIRHIGVFSDTHRHVSLFNSKGQYFKRDHEFARLGYSVIVSDGRSFETGNEFPGCQEDINFFKEKAKPKEIARKAVKTALTMLEAKECPSGKMPVVIGNGWGGVLFHEACGHALEASSVAKGLSCFSNKLGEMIASPLVTAIDDSTIPHSWGSIDIDDEGRLGEKRVLVKNGKLVNYMIDDFNGRRMNKEANGACRRQNYRFCPTSRMSNTYIANGHSTPEEIIKATPKGLYAVSFAGGSVDPSTGEFNFGCSEAYLIRDGKIAEPVKGATLIGRGEEILKKIDMVGNNLALAEGVCGASSGMVRTCVGQPTIRISEVVVGGRGEEWK